MCCINILAQSTETFWPTNVPFHYQHLVATHDGGRLYSFERVWFIKIQDKHKWLLWGPIAMVTEVKYLKTYMFLTTNCKQRNVLSATQHKTIKYTFQTIYMKVLKFAFE